MTHSIENELTLYVGEQKENLSCIQTEIINNLLQISEDALLYVSGFIKSFCGNKSQAEDSLNRSRSGDFMDIYKQLNLNNKKIIIGTLLGFRAKDIFHAEENKK